MLSDIYKDYHVSKSAYNGYESIIIEFFILREIGDEPCFE